jgi:hypothetical protein
MAEETREPSRIFPRILLVGLVVTGLIYVLVSVSAVTLVAPEQLGEGEATLLTVVEAGAPGFPLGVFAFITMSAVANSALINMLMASRLVYGMSRERVLPPVLGKVHAARRTPYVAIGFTTLRAFGLISVPQLGGITALLLLCVFTIANAAVLVCARTRCPTSTSRRRRADPRRDLLRLPGRSLDRPRPEAIRHRGLPRRTRRRAVVRDSHGQQVDGRHARGAGNGGHRRRRADKLTRWRRDLRARAPPHPGGNDTPTDIVSAVTRLPMLGRFAWSPTLL